MYRTPKAPGYAGRTSWTVAATFLATVFAANIAATYYLVTRFHGYQQLGQSWFQLGTHAIYAPWAWAPALWRLVHISDQAVRIQLVKAFFMAVAGLPVGLILARLVAELYYRRLAANKEDLHGSSRWATLKDLRKKELVEHGKGIILGSWYDADADRMLILRHHGPEHVIMAAPTRSGKGVGFVIPNMLEWPDAVLCNDPKGEVWMHTSGFRSRELGQRCIRFSPTAEDSDGYNPLVEVRLGTMKEVPDVQNIGQIIVKGGEGPEPTGAHAYWLGEAQLLFESLALHLLYEAKVQGKPTPGLALLLERLDPVSMTLREYLENNLDFQHDPQLKQGWTIETGSMVKTCTHPNVRRVFAGMIAKDADNFNGIQSTLRTKLSIFNDPLVARATSFSSFTMHDLLRSPVKHSIYVTIPMSDRFRLKPILRLLFTQAIERNSQRMDSDGPDPDPWLYQCLLMIDEFDAAGRMEIFADGLSYIGGFGFRAACVSTSYKSMEETYSRDSKIFSNTHIKLAYTPNDHGSADAIADLTGKTTVPHAALSFSGPKHAIGGPKSMNVHVEHVGRNLLTPDEVRGLKTIEHEQLPDGTKILKPGEALIFIPGTVPILGAQFLYLHDGELVRRSMLPPAKPWSQTEAERSGPNPEVARLREKLAAIAATA